MERLPLGKVFNVHGTCMYFGSYVGVSVTDITYSGLFSWVEIFVKTHKGR